MRVELSISGKKARFHLDIGWYPADYFKILGVELLSWEEDTLYITVLQVVKAVLTISVTFGEEL